MFNQFQIHLFQTVGPMINQETEGRVPIGASKSVSGYTLRETILVEFGTQYPSRVFLALASCL